MNKEEIRHFKSLLRQGSLRHMNILLDDKFQKELLNIIKDYEKLQQENQQLKRQIEIKDKWCQLIIDLGIDYDGYTQSDSLKLLIDELVNYASNSIKADDKTIAYTNGLSNYNILEEEIVDNNE